MGTTRVLLAVNIILIIVIGVLLVHEYVWSDSGLSSNGSSNDELSLRDVNFTKEELQAFQSIKNRLGITNTDPNFPDPEHIVLQWISLGNSSSASWDNYYQKSMEYLCFWEGQGAKGEWEAVISIYNSPNSTSDFVVEVSRFTWHSLEVTLDGNLKVSFPQVTNDTTSVGYATFRVSAIN